MPLALDCVLGKSQPKVVKYKINIRNRQAVSIHFPRDILGPFGTQGNRGFPMVLGNATSMLLAVTISHINKFTSCFMHFRRCYCMFGISAWDVPRYLSKHNPGTGVAAGFVLCGGPGASSCTSCSHPSWQGSWGAQLLRCCSRRQVMTHHLALIEN